MPKRNSKGQFVKRSSSHHSGGGGRTTTAIVVAAPRAPARRAPTNHKKAHHKKAHHRRRSGKGGRYGLKLSHLAAAGVGLAFLTGDNSPVKVIPEYAAKIPGAKTFGNVTMAGLVCLAADRWVKPNRWLRLAGVAGVIAGALQVGAKGTDFKWLGDAGDEFSGDILDDIQQ